MKIIAKWLSLGTVLVAVCASNCAIAQAPGLGGSGTYGGIVDMQRQTGVVSSGGPVVGGNVNLDVETGDVRITASQDSTAGAQIGSVTSGTVGGNVDSRVRTGDVTVTAEHGSCGGLAIGSVGYVHCTGE